VLSPAVATTMAYVCLFAAAAIAAYGIYLVAR
jgi:hypothetical protein